MKVRCFQPGLNRHTYRTVGYLVGMLLVRSFDRSERILSAMLCRGFAGRYYVLDHLCLGRADAAFSTAAATRLPMTPRSSRSSSVNGSPDLRLNAWMTPTVLSPKKGGAEIIDLVTKPVSRSYFGLKRGSS